MRKITERQKEVFNVMVTFPKGKGGNLRVWAKKLKMTPASVHDHLILMEKKGIVKKINKNHMFDGVTGWYPTVRGTEYFMENKLGLNKTKKI